MVISTSRFGEIDVLDEKIIRFKEGLPGFERCKGFALITAEETAPFHWLQAVDAADVALAVINPFLLFQDYAPRVAESVLQELGDPSDDEILLLTVAVIPSDPTNMTTNLVSPIIINASNNQGRQVILENNEYQIRQPIFNQVRMLVNGGEADAGTDTQA